MSTTILIGTYFTIMLGFAATHQRHFQNFNGSSKAFHSLLGLYGIVGYIGSIALLGYYIYAETWYIPIIVFLIAMLLAGLLFGLLDNIIGFFTTSMIGLIGFPVSAYLTFSEISKLIK